MDHCNYSGCTQPRAKKKRGQGYGKKCQRHRDKLAGNVARRKSVKASTETGTTSSIKHSTTIKMSQEHKQENERTVSRTVEERDGRKITEATTERYSTSVKTTLEITNTVERCETNYVKRIQSEEMTKAKQPPLKLSVAAFAKMLSQPSTKGPFQPPSDQVEFPLSLTPNPSVNTRLFLERLLDLGAVPPECYGWAGEFTACRPLITGARDAKRQHGYWFPCFPDMMEPENAFRHIRNKRNDLDMAFGDPWPTTWVDVTLVSGKRVFLPAYFAMYIFNNDEVASRAIEKLITPDTSSIMRPVRAGNAIAFDDGVSTVTLEDGTQKRYYTKKIDASPELRPLRELAYRQAKELEHEILVERPRRIAEEKRRDEEEKERWHKQQQQLGGNRRPAHVTPEVQAMQERIALDVQIQKTTDPRERRQRELQGPFYGVLTKGAAILQKEMYVAKQRFALQKRKCNYATKKQAKKHKHI